jgi:hypothetical protein
MSSLFWENVAARTDGVVTVEDFETAAYRLVTEQVLYYTDRHSRVAYGLVSQYERDFKQALAPLGVTIEVNSQLRYVYAKPQHIKAGTASVAQTRLALVLRAIYDESARLGQFTDDGEVVCELVELGEKYRLMTGLELPGKGEFAALMRAMKRWGIAKKSDDSGEGSGEIDPGAPCVVVIRPAIADILGETALLRLAQWTAAEAVNTDMTNESSEETSEVAE